MSVSPASARSAAGAAPAAPAYVYSDAYKWYILILLTAVYTTNFADRMIMSILLVPIQQEFQAPNWLMGFLAGTAFAIFYATLGLPIAVLADRSNRTRIVAVAVVVWSGMTALCGTAGQLWQLVLYRIGVGVGEAGGTPPSQSIISDLFTQKARGTALAIFSLGVPFGLVLGLYGGAQIAEHYGWRWAFIVLGLPGILLGILVYFTIREPERGAADGKVQSAGPPLPFLTVVRFMLTQRSLVHVLIGGTVTTFVGYSGVVWWPKWITTAHGLPLADLSLFLALVFGLAGGLGTFAAGYLGDALAKRDPGWMPRSVAVALLISVPFGIALYLVESSAVVFILIAIPAFLSSFYLPPSYAMTHGCVTPQMRAVATGFLLFVINLIGMGLGPLITGIISDWLEPSLGPGRAAGMALLSITVLNLWAAVHYWLAGQTFAADLKRAQMA